MKRFLAVLLKLFATVAFARGGGGGGGHGGGGHASAEGHSINGVDICAWVIVIIAMISAVVLVIMFFVMLFG
jgi:hypothetical protein